MAEILNVEVGDFLKFAGGDCWEVISVADRRAYYIGGRPEYGLTIGKECFIAPFEVEYYTHDVDFEVWAAWIQHKSRDPRFRPKKSVAQESA